MSKIIEVKLSDLNLPVFQAHRDIPEAHIFEISESIKKYGILQPLIIRDTDQGPEIVAGCVRYRSALLAGLKTVPCINMDLDPQGAEIVKMHENLKRIPVSHIDEAYSFLNMLETFSMSEENIALLVGKSQSYISQHISLIRFSPELADAVKNNFITFSHARELMRVDDPDARNRFFRQCIDMGVPIYTLHDWVNAHNRSIGVLPPSAESPPYEIYNHNGQQTRYICAACLKPIETSKICQVIYCPKCNKAIKDAISEERDGLSSKTPEKDLQDAPS